MISIVIPIFNELENLFELKRRLIKSAPNWNENFEVVLVDDGSTDGSTEVLRQFASEDDRFVCVILSRNFGHQEAISAGINISRGDAVVVMDGDLQDPPEELHRFLDKWREGYEVVYAIRTKRKENFFKKAGYFLFYRLLQRVSDLEIPLDSGDFCVMDRKVVSTMTNEIPEKQRFVRGLRAFAGFNQIGIEYERSARVAGTPKYTFRKLLKLAMDGLISFSNKPLKISTYIGLLVSSSSFVIGVLMFLQRIFDVTVLGHSPSETPGMASLAVGTFFLSGTILLSLGVIGEYISQIYLEVKKRPTYIVREILNSKE
jgi:polyisoprenyl-phosphate glycosyltransferase